MIDMLKASVFTVAAENVALYPRIMMRELSNGCDLKTFAENVAETKNELYRVNYLWECEHGIPVPFICFRNNGFPGHGQEVMRSLFPRIRILLQK